jgi:hypothetical protein
MLLGDEVTDVLPVDHCSQNVHLVQLTIVVCFELLITSWVKVSDLKTTSLKQSQTVPPNVIL